MCKIETEKLACPVRRLVVFGSYSDDDLYQRNRTLVDLLDSLSESSVVIRPSRRGRGHQFSAGLSWSARLARALDDARSLIAQRRLLKEAELIFIPYPAYLDVVLLWLLRPRSCDLLIVDAFLELKSTVVDDRRLLPSGSLAERALLVFQRFTLSRADLVLIDTEAQARVLRQQLAGSQTRVLPIPVGIDETQWRVLPPGPLGDRCRVLFWGTFIPLHGIEHILAAARLLEREGARVDFTLIGEGQMAEELALSLRREPLRTLQWERRLLATPDLRAALNRADIVLGIFGDSDKASAVLPYKVHQALASNRPVITRHGSAMDTIADTALGLHTCPPADPQALATEIVAVWKRLQSGWQPNTRTIYDKHLSHRVILDSLRRGIAER